MKRSKRSMFFRELLKLSLISLLSIMIATRSGLMGFMLNGLWTNNMMNSNHCFQGAYYHKVASPFGDWQGIEGLIILGVPQLDPNRFDPQTNWSRDGYNVYMGGNAGNIQEIDAGLTWGPVVDDNGKWVDHSGAFHPFWRNGSWNDAPVRGRAYWYPGEIVKMSVVVSGPGMLRLTISDPGPNPKRVFSKEFSAAYFGVGIPMQFKRVNDIAQKYNEGKPVIPTTSQIVNAVWLETYYLRTVGMQTERVPAINSNSLTWNCPPGHCELVRTPALEATGGEKVSIYGTPPTRNVPQRVLPSPLPAPPAIPQPSEKSSPEPGTSTTPTTEPTVIPLAPSASPSATPSPSTSPNASAPLTDDDSPLPPTPVPLPEAGS